MKIPPPHKIVYDLDSGVEEEENGDKCLKIS